jgi:hypothetical protein
MAPTHWQPSVELVVECLLLVPTPDMASSCLPLMTLLLQQMTNAALQPGGSGTAGFGEIAMFTLGELAPALLTLVAPAVHCCMLQTASLKQRRQLLRLWAGLLTALMQGAGAWCALRSALQAVTGSVWGCASSFGNPLQRNASMLSSVEQPSIHIEQLGVDG